MRVVILGASGNVGTSLLRALADEPEVDSILGLARRRPTLRAPKTEWAEADVTRSDLVPHLRGADAVVHLAWLIQPSHNLATLHETNVEGSKRVFKAAVEAGVGTIVYASSVGAYSPGPKDRAVDESWPTTGIATSFYSRHKAAVEHMLDTFENEHPNVRVVRLRPALIFKREAGAEVRRLFAGPLLPNFVVRRNLIPAVPDIPGLRFQAVHSYDVGHAYRLALVRDARGAFNIAAEPILDPQELSDLLGARLVKIPPRLIRTLADVTWRLHLQPTPAGWVDMGLQAPIMDWTRARTELGWEPERTSKEALLDVLSGIGDEAGVDTPPLAAGAEGPGRLREFLTGVGRR